MTAGFRANGALLELSHEPERRAHVPDQVLAVRLPVAKLLVDPVEGFLDPADDLLELAMIASDVTAGGEGLSGDPLDVAVAERYAAEIEAMYPAPARTPSRTSALTKSARSHRKASGCMRNM